MKGTKSYSAALSERESLLIPAYKDIGRRPLSHGTVLRPYHIKKHFKQFSLKYLRTFIKISRAHCNQTLHKSQSLKHQKLNVLVRPFFWAHLASFQHEHL